MESMGGGGGGALFLDGEWESLCKLFTTEQDQDLSFDHYLGHKNSNPLKDHQMSDPINQFFNQEAIDPTPSSNQFSQACSSDLSYDSSNGLNSMMQPTYSDDQMSTFDYLLEEGFLMGQMGFPALMEGPSGGPVTLVARDHHHQSSTKRKSISKCSSDDQVESTADEAPVPKKRARASKNAGKRKKKTEVVEEETSNVVSNAKKPNGDMSDNESNDSQEVINDESKEILNRNGKKRASRGAATDPQSLYARKRRERINERLRILQTLVPNGTKVDISTMLEEAVNYVKFMQLQIKLLSSDEMWMYAPLAYSGFDMGFYKRFSPYLLGP